jgi:MarR family 2-MHQ and catechol resistance regulon transcriptional repressor
MPEKPQLPEEEGGDTVTRRARRYHASYPEVSAETIASHLSVVNSGTILVRAVTRHLEPYKINPARYSLLRALFFSPDKMLPQSEIAREMGTSQPNVTQLLHVLEKDGLVERVVFPSNRRVTFARLTEAGKAKSSQLVPDMVRFMEKSTSSLTDEEKVELSRLLAKVRASAQDLLSEEESEVATTD